MFRTALIAAAMAVVLVVGTSAAGILPTPTEVFAPLFGGAVAQTEVIDKIGRPIGASDTDNGITITAEAIMGDQYNAVIVYTLTRDDGERFLPEGKGLDETYLMMGGYGGASWVKGGAHGGSWFVDEDPEDNQIQLVETASSNVAMTKGTANASFEDLQYWNAETEQAELLYPGKWKLRFEVDYEDCSVRLGGGETFSQDGLNFTIDEISVSPIAVRAAYTADEAVVWSDAPSGRQSEEDARQSQRYLELSTVPKPTARCLISVMPAAAFPRTMTQVSPSVPRARSWRKSSPWRSCKAFPWAAWFTRFPTTDSAKKGRDNCPGLRLTQFQYVPTRGTPAPPGRESPPRR